MTPAQRERVIDTINEILSDPKIAMSEGRRHKKAKSSAVDTLGLHFWRIGRVVYLAEDFAVMYPGEEAFSPDVFAVLDVPQPEDDPRMAWVVADEGRGPDFVLEVLHEGDRKKDLVTNVERYARLGIPEYFVYDRKKQRIHGHRLPGPEARRYQPIVGQGGRYTSLVLGVDLAIADEALKFYYSTAELIGSANLIGRLEKIAGDLQVRADEAQAEIEHARGELERAQAEREQAQAERERAQAERERAVAGLQEGILAALLAREVPVSEEARARVQSCQEPGTLQVWLLRALTASTTEGLFAP